MKSLESRELRHRLGYIAVALVAILLIILPPSLTEQEAANPSVLRISPETRFASIFLISLFCYAAVTAPLPKCEECEKLKIKHTAATTTPGASPLERNKKRLQVMLTTLNALKQNLEAGVTSKQALLDEVTKLSKLIDDDLTKLEGAKKSTEASNEKFLTKIRGIMAEMEVVCVDAKAHAQEAEIGEGELTVMVEP